MAKKPKTATTPLDKVTSSVEAEIIPTEAALTREIKGALDELRKPVGKSKPLAPLDRFKKTSTHWLSLFTAKDPDTSHTIELADDLPLFVYSRAQTHELKAVERVFTNRGREYKIAILPAALKKEGDGKTKEADWQRRFPGEREELVLEVVKYLASQDPMILDGDLGVPFTLAKIERILESSGHAMRRWQIKEALQILSRCKFIVSDLAGKTVIEESPLKSLVLAERGSMEKGVLQLNSFHTQAVKDGQYRGLNFPVALAYQSVLARRIHKHIGHYYTNAVTGTPFKATASELMRLAALSLVEKPNKWCRRIDAALEEVKRAGYVASFKCTPQKNAGRIVDYLYEIYLTQKFVDEIIQANGAQKRRVLQLKYAEPAEVEG